jgi:hypothetical protein
METNEEKLTKISRIVAKKRVKKMKRFYTHLSFFVAINIVVAAINFKVTPNELWFYWLTLGWGLAVCIHGVNIFSLKDWEANKISELMAK